MIGDSSPLFQLGFKPPQVSLSKRFGRRVLRSAKCQVPWPSSSVSVTAIDVAGEMRHSPWRSTAAHTELHTSTHTSPPESLGNDDQCTTRPFSVTQRVSHGLRNRADTVGSEPWDLTPVLAPGFHGMADAAWVSEPSPPHSTYTYRTASLVALSTGS